jgi:hypothetical protein
MNTRPVLGIMQPYLFPYLGYYQLMHAVGTFVVSDDVTFIKGGWINRNRVLINGEPAYFTVPLQKAPSTTLIRDMRIDDDGQAGWRKRQLRTLANFYRRASQFDAVFPLLESVFNEPTTAIATMARASLVRVAHYLRIETRFADSTAYANAHLKSQDRVIDTCQQERASTYINAIGGQALYSTADFAARGITLKFLKSRPIEYPQFRTPFATSLSIIDVLMFNSRDQARALLDCYDLI